MQSIVIKMKLKMPMNLELFYDKQMEKLELYSNNKIISNTNCGNIIKSKLSSIIGDENIVREN